MVERIPGRRGGTFITEPKIDVDITGLAGFTEQLRRGHRRATRQGGERERRTGLEKRGQGARSGARGRGLRDRPGAVGAIVNRWRSSAPTCRCRLFPDCSSTGLTGSLYALLGREYDQSPQTATEVLEP